MSSKVCAEMPRNTQKYNIGNGLMVNVSEGLLGRGATLFCCEDFGDGGHNFRVSTRFAGVV